MQVRYVNYGIANNVVDIGGNYIEMHEGLKNFPELHDYVLKHELEHTDNPNFNKEDFMLDVMQVEYNYKDLLKFMAANPSSLLQLLPVYMKNKVVYYDKNMIVVWGGTLCIAALAITLGFIL